MDGKGAIKLTVRIGEFLDIICPQYEEDAKDPELFDLYRLGYDDYSTCNIKDQGSIFQCNDPTKSVKLTTKFQKFSPNPLGFTFKPNQTYYYVAVPPEKKDCNSGFVVEVFVLGKHQKHPNNKEPVVPDLVPVTDNPPIITKATKIPKSDKKTFAPTHQSASAVVGPVGGGSTHVRAGVLSIISSIIMLWIQT